MSVSKSHRPSLGRGLSALISTGPAVPVLPSEEPDSPRESVRTMQLVSTEQSEHGKDGVTHVPVSNISGNAKQPRKEFKEAELNELTQSITELGVLQPILLRPVGDGYEIVAGERRFRAAQKAGLKKVPAIIRPLSDREALEISIVENVQRENLNPIEEARAYERLAAEFGLTHAQIAERVGKERSSIANMLRLLRLPADLLQFLSEGKLSIGHAKAILGVREPSAQLSLAKKVMTEGLSVRDLENIVARVVVLDTGKSSRAAIGDKKAKGERKLIPGHFGEVEDDLRKVLGTRVAIRHKSTGRGRIEIEYFSEEELSRVVDLLIQR